jgi:hypothetical protein
MHQMALKYQITIKYTKIFRTMVFKNIPKLWFFWFANIPSGNPVGDPARTKSFIFDEKIGCNVSIV